MQRHILPLLGGAVLLSGLARAQWDIDELSTVRSHLSGVAVGDLILFAGGLGPANAPSDVVDIYDTTTDTWTQAQLTVARGGLAATVVGDLVFFAGGGDPGNPVSDVIDVFNAQTMAWSVANPLSVPRRFTAAASVGQKAFFAGGIDAVGVSDVVDIYDAALGLPSDPLAWAQTTLTVARVDLAATAVGSQVLFAGGTDFVFPYADVDIYDDATGLWSNALLSQARGGAAATTVGDLAFFGGGQLDGSGTMSDVVDIYNFQSGVWTVGQLSQARTLLTATSLGNTALFAGGAINFGTLSDRVDLYNAGTGKWETDSLSQARGLLASASAGERAFFAGGLRAGGKKSKVVDIYHPAGLNYCSALANSTGVPASISADGSASLSANDLVLKACDLPDQFCLFFHGPTTNQVPFGNGNLCVGGTLVRILPPVLASGGLAEVALDLPSAGINATGTRNFQCWYRDPAAGGAGYNTSDALSVTFTN